MTHFDCVHCAYVSVIQSPNSFFPIMSTLLQQHQLGDSSNTVLSVSKVSVAFMVIISLIAAAGLCWFFIRRFKQGSQVGRRIGIMCEVIGPRLPLIALAFVFIGLLLKIAAMAINVWSATHSTHTHTHTHKQKYVPDLWRMFQLIDCWCTYVPL